MTFRIVAVFSPPSGVGTEAAVKHAETMLGVQQFIAEYAERDGDLISMSVYYVSDNTGPFDYE